MSEGAPKFNTAEEVPNPGTPAVEVSHESGHETREMIKNEETRLAGNVKELGEKSKLIELKEKLATEKGDSSYTSLHERIDASFDRAKKKIVGIGGGLALTFGALGGAGMEIAHSMTGSDSEMLNPTNWADVGANIANVGLGAAAATAAVTGLIYLMRRNKRDSQMKVANSAR